MARYQQQNNPCKSASSAFKRAFETVAYRTPALLSTGRSERRFTQYEALFLNAWAVWSFIRRADRMLNKISCRFFVAPFFCLHKTFVKLFCTASNKYLSLQQLHYFIRSHSSVFFQAKQLSLVLILAYVRKVQ